MIRKRLALADGITVRQHLMHPKFLRSQIAKVKPNKEDKHV